ncbi:MAG TPA: WYL domain-containing protein [Thermoguttaceae bacterium]|nr:WYL domain-containing protein [Thermoguttaceae bacterium]
MSFSPERYKQVARACKVLEILQNSRYGKTTRELADEVVRYMGLPSVSLKSIERDVKFWQGYGFPIDSHKTSDPERRTVWKLDRSYLELPKLQISVLELLAFAVGRELLFPLAGTPYWEGIQMLWSKMRESLPEPLWKHFERLRPSVVVRGVVAKSYAEKEGMLSALNRAIYQHRVTDVRYQGLGRSEAEERAIEPHAIVLSGGNIYVAATDAGDDQGEFKLFKLDRLTRVTPRDQHFKPREDFDPDDLFAASVGVFRSGRPTRFRIRVTGHAARWVVEEPLHPQQVVEPTAPGGRPGELVLEIPAAHQEEILPRVLALGEHAEVLEPESCREAIRETARRVVQNYTSDASDDSD